MIKDETYDIIDKLAKSRSSRGSFAYYQRDDIYQEIWCMCLEAMGRYDNTIGPIENYLVRHVTNRMKNLKRDKYFRPGCDIATSGLARARMNLVNALPIECESILTNGVVMCGDSTSVDPVLYLLCDETVSYIIDKLPNDLVDYFLNMMGNNKVRGPITAIVRQKIAEILTEREQNGGG